MAALPITIAATAKTSVFISNPRKKRCAASCRAPHAGDRY
jgi:hypothetical protein